MAVTSDFQVFNPITNTALITNEVMNYLLFTPLIQFDDDLEAIPALAEEEGAELIVVGLHRVRRVLDLLRRRDLTLGVAESLTGGMMGSRICDVPGASDVFRGAVVSYASDVKFELLGVPEGPVVSAAAAAGS